MDKPKVERIYSGWAAYEGGWAVHAATKEEALAKFEERKAFRDNLKDRPDWYMNPENPRLRLDTLVRSDER